MNWDMNQNDPRVKLTHSLPRCFAAMGRTVIDNQKQTLCRDVWFLRKNLAHQSLKGEHACCAFTASDHVSTSHVPRRQILQGAAPFILEFDSRRTLGARWERRVTTNACLNAGLLVSAQDVVFRPQRHAAPISSVQIQNSPRLLGELGITRENPVFELPWLDCVMVQDAPHGATADWFLQRLSRPRRYVIHRLATDRQSRF